MPLESSLILLLATAILSLNANYVPARTVNEYGTIHTFPHGEWGRSWRCKAKRYPQKNLWLHWTSFWSPALDKMLHNVAGASGPYTEYTAMK